LKITDWPRLKKKCDVLIFKHYNKESFGIPIVLSDGG
jgi:hypothetical protein